MNDVSMTPCHHFQIQAVLNPVSYTDDMESSKHHSLLLLIFILN